MNESEGFSSETNTNMPMGQQLEGAPLDGSPDNYQYIDANFSAGNFAADQIDASHITELSSTVTSAEDQASGIRQFIRSGWDRLRGRDLTKGQEEALSWGTMAVIGALYPIAVGGVDHNALEASRQIAEVEGLLGLGALEVTAFYKVFNMLKNPRSYAFAGARVNNSNKYEAEHSDRGLLLSKWDRFKERFGSKGQAPVGTEPLGAAGLIAAGVEMDDTILPPTEPTPITLPAAPRSIPVVVHNKGELFGGDSAEKFDMTQRVPLSSELTPVHAPEKPYASDIEVRKIIERVRRTGVFEGVLIGPKNKVYSELTDESIKDARYYADGSGRIVDLEDGTEVLQSAEKRQEIEERVSKAGGTPDESRAVAGALVNFRAIAEYEKEKSIRQRLAPDEAKKLYSKHYEQNKIQLGLTEMSDEDKARQAEAEKLW